ncbi:MAG TPA: DUF5318 family protein, partial [Acidimicrobiales bacterium]|nr:DUF5318 family protein [Acidimicrobiales bacterium]
MRIGPDFDGGGGANVRLGQVEYRLQRDGIIREFQRGRLSRLDVCDAQPELLRVARNFGAETPTDCPICEGARLVHVSFVFGPRLPASGRVVESPSDMAKISRQGG